MKWKSSKILSNKYEVSDSGSVRNSKTKKPIKLTLNKCGYLYVSVFIDMKVYSKRMHRVVACEFIENKSNYTDVHHKNGIKTDNRVENLEWCSRKQNIAYNKYINIKNKRNFKKFKPYKGASSYSKNTILLYKTMRNRNNPYYVKSKERIDKILEKDCPLCVVM